MIESMFVDIYCRYLEVQGINGTADQNVAGLYRRHEKARPCKGICRGSSMEKRHFGKTSVTLARQRSY